MQPHIKSFSIGEFQAFLFRDMMWNYKGSDYFFNALDKAEEALRIYDQTMQEIPSPFVCLLLIKGDEKILIDTGLGFRSEPMEFRGMRLPFYGKTLQLFDEISIDPATITHVILTHFHPDHIGGVCNENGDPNFPHAQYILHQDEWDYWFGSQSQHENPLFHVLIEQNINPIRDLDIRMIKKEADQIFSGINAFQVPGHTPGQIAISITSNAESLLFVSDVWLHPLHIEHLDWKTNYDQHHELARKSRINMLEVAHNNQMKVQSFHFNWPGLGYVDKVESGWKWVASD
jgi:glyoxylase-like metal-dependent hydrolase (beta-lactamase superfamily II)